MKVPEARGTLAFLILWLIFPGQFILMAQVDRGAVVGTVTDVSGAVVSGATITVTNTETNQSNQYTTSESGGYAANLLRIGNYTVTAEKSGFQKTVQENVDVGVNQVVRVDLRLQVGMVTQTVEVEAAPSLIQTETTSLGTIETERRIVTLPLNERNFIALAYLGPGANSGQQGTNASGGVFENERGNEALSVNGLRVSNNNFLLDGVDNNEFGLGGTIVLPPPDAIQEFRIEENSMSAEFGRGGAAVNVALKSGTNDVHGGAYEFLRNDKLDARNYFDVEKPPFQRNQFGALLGGPIRKDRTFIFGDYQGVRIRQGLTFVSTVPTEQMRAGDFSELGTPIYDPATTDPNTGARQLINPTAPFVIPANRINAVGQRIAQLYPLPNRAGAGLFDNFVLNPKRVNNQNSFDIRVDHRLREQDQLFGHYSFSNVDSLRPAPLGDLGGQDCCPSNSTNRAQHLGLGWTHTFKPNLLNDLHGGAFRYVVDGLPLNYGKNISQDLGIPNANRGDPTSSGLSFIEVAGFQNLGDSLWTPEFAVENIFQIADTLSWVRGKHSLKFGVDFRRQQRNFFQTTAPRGQFGFTGAYTQDLSTGTGGNGLADLLLGIPQSFRQDTLVGKYPTRYWDLAGFVQDDVHVTPDLTLNLGLRYEVFSPASGRIGNFDLQTAKVINEQGPNGVPHAGVKFDKNNWGPRVGLAWVPFGNKGTVVRGAFGVFYSTEGNIFDDLGLSPPYLSVNSQFFSAGTVPTQSVADGFPATVTFPDPNFPEGTVRTNGPKHIMPYIMEWNFNIQRDFGRNWVAQVAYVGTRGVRLWNHESTNLNQPPLPLDSNFSVGNFGRPYFDRLPNLDTILPLNFPQLSMIYHAFQTSVNKRFANGFNVQASYTFGKNLGTADGNVGTVAIQNAYNIAAEKGPVPPDLRHRFVVSYMYELPIGRGKPFLGRASGVVEAILGGWQISGITLLRSAEAYTAGLSFDPTNTESGSPRPDRIHDPYDFSFEIPTQAAMGCSSPGKQTLDCFYNQAAFVLPPLAPGQTFAHRFGNSGRSTLRGPDQRNFDFAALKRFRLTERQSLEFRTEFFNLFNTPQFALPDGTVDVPGGASISSTLPDNQREIQLGLKWTF